MAVTWEGMQRFGHSVVQLPSFPLFLAYLLMVFLYRFWKKVAPPLSLKPVMIIYNFACSCLSIYSFLGFVYCLYSVDYLYSRRTSPLLTHMFFVYWVAKCLELLDTVFMILRHRSRQMSFLHVFHHSTMIVLSDYGYNLSPWPAMVFVPALNSFVHIFLYFYYGLTALETSRKPTWKRRLTELQIVQFMAGFVYLAVGYVYHGFCAFAFYYDLSMIGFFCNFYYHTYIKVKCEKKTN